MYMYNTLGTVNLGIQALGWAMQQQELDIESIYWIHVVYLTHGSKFNISYYLYLHVHVDT